MKVMDLINGRDVELITGCARGADQIPYFFKHHFGTAIKEFPADWTGFGKAAGPIRNREMAEYAAPDGELIAFWDGVSTGTKDMINVAGEFGLKITIIEY